MSRYFCQFNNTYNIYIYREHYVTYQLICNDCRLKPMLIYNYTKPHTYINNVLNNTVIMYVCIDRCVCMYVSCMCMSMCVFMHACMYVCMHDVWCVCVYMYSTGTNIMDTHKI